MKSVAEKILATGADGKMYVTRFYNPHAIISILANCTNPSRSSENAKKV